MRPLYEIDLGPLELLLGEWKGNQGKDLSPEPDDTERNSYYETLIFEEVGRVKNAEEQYLAGISYTQIVQRSTNDKMFHHQHGYWTWDKENNTVNHTFCIPRGVAVMATGPVKQEGDGYIFDVKASANDIMQAPFMEQKAKTKAFNMTLSISKSGISYQQMTLLDIYGREFEHTDTNVLSKA